MLRKRPVDIPIDEVITNDEFYTHNDEIINPDNSPKKAITWIDPEVEDEEQELFKRRNDRRTRKSVLQQDIRQTHRFS